MDGEITRRVTIGTLEIELELWNEDNEDDAVIIRIVGQEKLHIETLVDGNPDIVATANEILVCPLL